MEDWNGLRLVLALHRTGTLGAAARLLGVDHSTAFRRLKLLETRLGVQLFDRLPAGGYQASDAGVRVATAAERIEDEVMALDRDLTGRDHRLSGRLRVTASETLAQARLTAHLARFQRFHPGVGVELVIDNRVLSLTRREADVALRPVRPREGELWGRRLAGIAWAIYRSAGSDAAQADPARVLRDLPFVGWEETASGIRAAEWLAGTVPPERFTYRTNSLVNQLIAARLGIGLALLPCYLGDPDPGVERALPGPIEAIAGELWIVTHADLRNTARVRMFFEVVGDGLAREAALFEGGQPGRSAHR